MYCQIRQQHGPDRELLEQSIKGELSPQSHVISYETKSGLVVFGLDNYSDINVEISVTGVGRWARRAIFQHFFHYLFNELQVKRASALVHPDNEKCIKLITQLGFVHECSLRGIDVDLFSLLPTDTNYYEFTKTKVKDSEARADSRAGQRAMAAE